MKESKYEILVFKKLEPELIETWKKLDSAVYKKGDDMFIKMRYEATFFLNMDLKDFPEIH